MARYGYARISTHSQRDDSQLDALRQAGCERIFTDTASGRLAHRPEWDACLDHLRAGDELTVTALISLMSAGVTGEMNIGYQISASFGDRIFAMMQAAVLQIAAQSWQVCWVFRCSRLPSASEFAQWAAHISQAIAQSPHALAQAAIPE